MRPAILALLLLTACENASSNLDSGANPPRDGGARDGGAPDSGQTVGDGGGDQPIVDRASRNEQTCTLGTVLFHGGPVDGGVPIHWGRHGHSVAAGAGGQVLAARVERQSDDPFGGGTERFVVSSLSPQGVFGPSTELRSATASDVLAPSLLPDGAGFALLWLEGAMLGAARLDAAGALSEGPTMHSFDAFSDRVVAMAGDGGRFAVAGRRTQDSQLRLWLLDGHGAPSHPAIDVGNNPAESYYFARPAITGTGDGFALLWSERSGQTSDLYFARYDAAGSPVVARQRVSEPDATRIGTGEPNGFGPNPPALLRLDTGFLAAWAESYPGSGGLDQMGAFTVVRLARLGEDGTRSGPIQTLRGKTLDIEEGEPTLRRMGDRVLVSWARGDIIYICGGCTPSDRIDSLLIDPEAMVPVSNVVSIEPQAGGLLSRSVAVSGAQVTMSFEIVFHVHNEHGTASMRCE